MNKALEKKMYLYVDNFAEGSSTDFGRYCLCLAFIEGARAATNDTILSCIKIVKNYPNECTEDLVREMEKGIK